MTMRMAILRFIFMFTLIFLVIPYGTLYLVGSVLGTTVSEQIDGYIKIFNFITSITAEQFFMILFVGLGGMFTIMPFVLILGCSCNHNK